MIFEDILTMAISNGIFAVLFVFLLFYLLRDSANREKKYQETVEKLAKHLDIVEDMKDDVSNIKEDVLEIKNIVIFKGKKEKSQNTENKYKSFNFNKDTEEK